MTISASTLTSIQQAGQAVHDAYQAVMGSVQGQAELVVAGVASQPFSPDNDRIYAQLRAVAGLAHELQALEDQLKAVYSKAEELAKAPPPALLMALPGRSVTARLHHDASAGAAQDAVIRPATRTPKAQPARSFEVPKRMSANDEKVLSYLKTVLDRKAWKPVTQATISQGASVPLGSVGLAVRRLLALGMVREGHKGSYRMA